MLIQNSTTLPTAKNLIWSTPCLHYCNSSCPSIPATDPVPISQFSTQKPNKSSFSMTKHVTLLFKTFSDRVSHVEQKSTSSLGAPRVFFSYQPCWAPAELCCGSGHVSFPHGPYTCYYPVFHQYRHEYLFCFLESFTQKSSLSPKFPKFQYSLNLTL